MPSSDEIEPEGPEKRIISKIERRIRKASDLSPAGLEDQLLRLKESERALGISMKEWSAISRSVNGDRANRYLRERGKILLRRIASLRNDVNERSALLYNHCLARGIPYPKTLGKGQYPDLYNPICLSLALQKLGVPALDADIRRLSGNDGWNGNLPQGEGFIDLLLHLRELGIEGRWYDLRMGPTRSNTVMTVQGSETTASLRTLRSRMRSRWLDRKDVSVSLLGKGGREPVYRIKSMDIKGFVTLISENEDGGHKDIVVKESDLSDIWMSESYRLRIRFSRSTIMTKKLAQEILLEEKDRGVQVMIEVISREDPGIKDILVDEVDPFARKISLITSQTNKDPKRKKITLYGKDFDNLVVLWEKRDFKMICLRKVDTE